MIDYDDVESLAYSGAKIKHIKTGNIYQFIFPTKAKHDGEWISGASYQAYSDCAQYWRSSGDFDGFEVLEQVE